MSKEKIQADIEKLKNNKFIPEDLKQKRLKQLQAQLNEATVPEKSEPKKTVRRAKPKFSKGTNVKIKDSKHPHYGKSGLVDFKTFDDKSGEYAYTINIDDTDIILLQSQLTKALKPKAEYKYKGKNVDELDEKECEELRKEVAERRKKQAKSEKKSKSKPVIERVASNVATAAKQAIKNVAAADIKDDPKDMIAKMEKLEKLTRQYLQDMRSILGEDYDKETIDGEMKDIHAVIVQLKKKYA